MLLSPSLYELAFGPSGKGVQGQGRQFRLGPRRVEEPGDRRVVKVVPPALYESLLTERHEIARGGPETSVCLHVEPALRSRDQTQYC
jgi:hypothetical protein